MHMPIHFRLAASAEAAAATFLAVSRLIGSPYGVFGCASGTYSFGLAGSAGTRAKAPVLVRSATHRAPATSVKRCTGFLPRKVHRPRRLWFCPGHCGTGCTKHTLYKRPAQPGDLRHKPGWSGFIWATFGPTRWPNVTPA